MQVDFTQYFDTHRAFQVYRYSSSTEKGFTVLLRENKPKLKFPGGGGPRKSCYFCGFILEGPLAGDSLLGACVDCK